MGTFHIGIEWAGDAVHLRVRGELDPPAAEELVERMESISQSSAGLALVDLSEVSAIDAAGVRALRDIQLAAHAFDGFEVILVRPSRAVRGALAAGQPQPPLRLGEPLSRPV